MADVIKLLLEILDKALSGGYNALTLKILNFNWRVFIGLSCWLVINATIAGVWVWAATELTREKAQIIQDIGDQPLFDCPLPTLPADNPRPSTGASS